MATAASLDLDALQPGAELRLNESLAAVEAVAPSDAGNVVPVVEELADSRLLVAVAPDDTRVLRRAGTLTDEQLHPGDHVLVDLKSQLVLERIDRAEITDLVLEQVPEVSFDQIGGWGSRSRRSATPSSCPSCSRTSTAPTACARRRACCCTARPAAARR